jgi:hypothetical protein
MKLNEQHYEHLKASALSDDIITERGYCSICAGSIHDWRQVAGHIHSDKLLKTILHDGALAFPLYRCADSDPYTWVIRPDLPRKSRDNKAIKYEYPANTPNVLDILPRYRLALTDPDIDVWVTEGAKKADALATHLPDVLPINENGVWGFRSRRRALDDFSRIVWEGRRVVLAPDGDVRLNKQVLQAVQRQARLFMAKGAREVLICMLPQPREGPKIGVDDYLSTHPADQLDTHLVEIGTVEQSARVPLMKHPQTGMHLYLPPGYDVQNQTLVRNDNQGTRHFYTGMIAITGIGKNLLTGEEYATVFWNGIGGHQELTVPRVALANTRGCTDHLGTAGAAIHAGNARELSRFLVEFIQENHESLPRIDYADRLGNIGEGGLVLPAGQIGLGDQTRYTGPEIRVGTDRDAYPRCLAQIVGDPERNIEHWSGTDTLWAVLALTLAAPVLARLRSGRNPVLVLAGASGSGKTTLAHLATGTYGDPTRAPLQIQCGSGTTTAKGIQQVLAQLNGIPMHLEDVHMLMERDPRRLAGLIYDFANGQLRSYGTLDQRGGGGQELGGTMVMTGEMIPDWQHAGNQNRVFLFDCSHTPPLGAPADSNEGLRRAVTLEQARAGAGIFGMRVCERLWRGWESLRREIEILTHDDALKDLRAWRLILATAAAVLGHAMDETGLYLDHAALMRRWAQMYEVGRQDHDPAQDAFDRVLMMLTQCELTDNATYDAETKMSVKATWQWLHYDRKPVAAKRVGEGHWRVFTTSPQWMAIVGPGTVTQFGAAWLKAGLILRQKDGTVSSRSYVGKGAYTPHCILVSDQRFNPDFIYNAQRGDHEAHERS